MTKSQKRIMCAIAELSTCINGAFNSDPKHPDEAIVKRIAVAIAKIKDETGLGINPDEAKQEKLDYGCCICHRPLKSEKSKKAGMGPTCAYREKIQIPLIERDKKIATN